MKTYTFFTEFRPSSGDEHKSFSSSPAITINFESYLINAVFTFIWTRRCRFAILLFSHSNLSEKLIIGPISLFERSPKNERKVRVLVCGYNVRFFIAKISIPNWSFATFAYCNFYITRFIFNKHVQLKREINRPIYRYRIRLTLFPSGRFFLVNLAHFNHFHVCATRGSLSSSSWHIKTIIKYGHFVWKPT